MNNSNLHYNFILNSKSRMQPRRSFVPKVEFGALVKRYQRPESEKKIIEEPKPSPSEVPIEDPIEVLPVVLSRSGSKPKSNDLSMAEIEIPQSKFKGPPNRERIKMLSKPFISGGRVDIKIGEANHYIEICDIVYSIELTRMRLYYSEHDRFVEVIDAFTQRMNEFFRTEM